MLGKGSLSPASPRLRAPCPPNKRDAELTESRVINTPSAPMIEAPHMPHVF